MAMMDVCGPIFCPTCPPKTNRHGGQVGERLVCSDANYSGTGTDMANCPVCGKGYCISYMVDEITHCPDWDVDIPAEQAARMENLKNGIQSLEKEITTKQQEIKRREQELEKLKKKNENLA